MNFLGKNDLRLLLENIKKLSDEIGFDIEFVDTLPEVGKEKVFYFVKRTDEKSDNKYDEYVWVPPMDGIPGYFERIGSADVDLSQYVKKDHFFEGTTAEINEALPNLEEGTHIKCTDDYLNIVGNLADISSIGDGRICGAIKKNADDISALSGLKEKIYPSLNVLIAGQIDLGASDWAISNKKIVSAVANGTYLLFPFAYGGRWFLKALTTNMENVGAGTSISNVGIYYLNY